MKTRYGLVTALMLVIAAAGLLAQRGPSFGISVNQDGDELEFISKPSPTARVNTPYLYTAQAISSDPSATIRYYGKFYFLMSMQMMMQPLPIDSVTGVVNWTPALRGWYEIVIVALSSKGGHDHQDFNVLVSGGNGTIQGRVTDTLNSGIPNIIVRALNTTITPMMGPSESDGGFFSYNAKTDSNGYYRIEHVEPGSYKLQAISTTPNFASQWYDGQSEPAFANVVTVADSPNVSSADFVLRGGPSQHPKVTASGRVIDTLGMALKVPNTRVFFVRAGFALNSNSSVDDFRESLDDDHTSDFRMDGGSPYVFATTVDTLGNYRLRIPMGNYIAFAQAPGFATTFFQNQTDFTLANVIVFQADSADINFTLVPLPPVALGSISGTVTDSSKAVGVRARVIAFRDHWRDRDDFHVAPSYTTDTDSTGAYTVNHLLPGNYIVFAIPVGKYAPAYYTTDTSSTHWKRATKLAVNGNSLSGINIFVRALPASMQGYTGIVGSVKVSGQSAVAGAFVYAMTNGQVSGYGITSSSGSYSISGLAPGTYSVGIDRPGFDEVASQSATLTYNNTLTNNGVVKSSSPVIQTVNFSVSSTTTSVASSANIVLDYRLGQNYPNPFNPSTTISFALPRAGLTTLKVYNILGQEVTTLLNGYQTSGVHQVLFNADKLSSGVYFYELQSGTFVQSKKMVLLK